jgi:ArsR family transcriptional regulator, virulence genes transcriptional regulator
MVPNMYDAIVYDLQAEICHAMSHSARQKIIHILFEGPQSVGDIANLTDLGQSAVSRHLAILRHNGIVVSERHGQEIIYHVANPKIIEVCNIMRTVLSDQVAERSIRLMQPPA